MTRMKNVCYSNNFKTLYLLVENFISEENHTTISIGVNDNIGYLFILKPLKTFILYIKFTSKSSTLCHSYSC